MKGESTYHHVNTTFSDAVVSFTSIADNPHLIVACEGLYVSISAISSDYEKLPSFTVSGGYIPSKCPSLHDKASVNSIAVFYDVQQIYPHLWR